MYRLATKRTKKSEKRHISLFGLRYAPCIRRLIYYLRTHMAPWAGTV